MVKKKVKKVLRHFQLKLRNKDQKQTFDRYQKKTIMSNKDVTDEIMSLVAEGELKLQLNFTPLYEAEMLKLMIKQGVSRTRQSLKHMRDRGELVDPVTGDQLWGTDGSTIVYNSEGVIKLLKKKQKTKVK